MALLISHLPCQKLLPFLSVRALRQACTAFLDNKFPLLDRPTKGTSTGRRRQWLVRRLVKESINRYGALYRRWRSLNTLHSNWRARNLDCGLRVLPIFQTPPDQDVSPMVYTHHPRKMYQYRHFLLHSGRPSTEVKPARRSMDNYLFEKPAKHRRCTIPLTTASIDVIRTERLSLLFIVTQRQRQTQQYPYPNN